MLNQKQEYFPSSPPESKCHVDFGTQCDIAYGYWKNEELLKVHQVHDVHSPPVILQCNRPYSPLNEGGGCSSRVIDAGADQLLLQVFKAGKCILERWYDCRYENMAVWCYEDFLASREGVEGWAGDHNPVNIWPVTRHTPIIVYSEGWFTHGSQINRGVYYPLEQTKACAEFLKAMSN